MKFLEKTESNNPSKHFVYQSVESFGRSSTDCLSQGNNTGNALNGLIGSILRGNRQIGRSGPSAGDNCTSCHSSGQDLGPANAGGADRLAILAPIFDGRDVAHDNMSDQPNICGDGMYDANGITYLTTEPNGIRHNMTRFIPDPNSQQGMFGITYSYEGTNRVSDPSYFQVQNGAQMRRDLEAYLAGQVPR